MNKGIIVWAALAYSVAAGAQKVDFNNTST